MASETLRLEMEPLGVRVLTVKSGLVNTSLAINLPEFKLPPDSFYRSIEGTIAVRAKMGELAQLGMELQTYAESIVRDVLATTSGAVWRGSFALFLRCLLASLPRYLVVSIQSGLPRAMYSRFRSDREVGKSSVKRERARIDADLNANGKRVEL